MPPAVGTYVIAKICYDMLHDAVKRAEPQASSKAVR